MFDKVAQNWNMSEQFNLAWENERRKLVNWCDVKCIIISFQEKCEVHIRIAKHTRGNSRWYFAQA